MKFGGAVGNIDKLLNKLNTTPVTVASGVQTALKQCALEIHKEAVLGIRNVSRGEIMTRYHPKRTVVVSEPGGTPNSDTGQLIQSIQFEIDGNTAYVGSNLKYAAWLEFGTKWVAARPWLAPALMKCSDKVAEIMKKAINGSLQKSLGIADLVKDFSKLSKAGSKTLTKTAKKVTKARKKAARAVKKARRRFK